MAKTQKFDLDTDTTLGGSNASDYIAPSQKAIKTYVDNHSGSGGTATDVQINGTSITSNDVANIITNSAYNASSNKIATMSDLPTIDSALSSTSTNPVQNKVINSALSNKYDASNPNGYTSNVGTVTKVNNTSPDSSGNVTLSIPAAQVNSDWNATSGKAQILNKPSLSTVATSGSYNDLSNKPTIPTVNNATLTIQKNGSAVKTFTANASADVTCNITVPTKTSDITNDSGYITGITSSDVTTALGYTPYNSTNPSGYQANVIETVKVNGTAQTVTSKAVDISVPTKVSQLTNDSGYTTNTGTVTSVNGVSPVNGNVTLSIPDAQVQANWNETNTSSKAYIQNKPTIPTVNNATLTITQGGTTKGTFTANASSNVTIDIDAGGSVDIDNSTITENSSNQIQTVAVKDNRSGNAIKTWTGTRAQYNAITTKDANTLYNITDDSDITYSMLELLYPVGSVYLSTNSTCPLASLFGTWTLVSSGKALWTGDGTNGNTTISAGLPNIEGELRLGHLKYQSSSGSFAKSYETTTSSNFGTTGSSKEADCIFDASDSNPIYGNSTTVQPPAYVVNVWRRIA